MINKVIPRKIHLIRKKMWDASVNNFKKYLNKKTGLIKKKFLENRNCPSCESSTKKLLLNKHIYINNISC